MKLNKNFTPNFRSEASKIIILKKKLNNIETLQSLFNSRLNKKSLFLKNLSKINDEQEKAIEKGKAEVLVSKFLGRENFNRDYSLLLPFYPKISHKKQKNTELLKFFQN